MATITWKGEPGPGEDKGPETMTWGGKTFKRGEAVEITDPELLRRANGSTFFEVSGYEEAKPADVPQEPAAWKAPSEQGPAQYPVPKPGEPVRLETAPTKTTKPIPRV